MSFLSGRYASEAAALARRVDVAIVFVTQWIAEGIDAPTLTLPDEQDALIAAVAAANPLHGRRARDRKSGDDAVARSRKRGRRSMVSGIARRRRDRQRALRRVDATGRLPITFPAGGAQLVHPELPGLDALISIWANGESPQAQPLFSVSYTDGSEVGYRRFVKQGFTPLFAFGHGLSYTTFRYSDFVVRGGETITASFDVTNTGSRREATRRSSISPSGLIRLRCGCSDGRRSISRRARAVESPSLPIRGCSPTSIRNETCGLSRRDRTRPRWVRHPTHSRIVPQRKSNPQRSSRDQVGEVLWKFDSALGVWGRERARRARRAAEPRQPKRCVRDRARSRWALLPESWPRPRRFGTRSTSAARSSLRAGGRTSAHRPAQTRSVIARRAATFSASSTTAAALPKATTER